MISLAVDIDGTLADTLHYYMIVFSHMYGTSEGLTPDQLLKKYRMPELVPYWPKEKVIEWIRNHDESNNSQEEIPPIFEARETLEKISKKVSIGAYLTARTEAVHEGTLRWLKKHGFPEAPLQTKPFIEDGVDGSVWKARILKELYPDIQGLIDDNEKIVAALAPDYKGTIFLYNSESAHLAQPNIITCSTWKEVEEAVNKLVTL